MPAKDPWFDLWVDPGLQYGNIPQRIYVKESVITFFGIVKGNYAQSTAAVEPKQITTSVSRRIYESAADETGTVITYDLEYVKIPGNKTKNFIGKKSYKVPLMGKTNDGGFQRYATFRASMGIGIAAFSEFLFTGTYKISPTILLAPVVNGSP